MKLFADAFRRMDEAPDEAFYAIPKFVTHIDSGAIQVVTDIYRNYLPAEGDILDLMSSWVSHLPDDVNYRRVVGLGMNERELARNKQLDEWLVHDLNRQPDLPFMDDEFDAVVICVSIDYLIHPVEVLREVGRVLRHNAPIIITCSNRFFESKVIAAWLSLSDHDRVYLIRTYLVEAGCFENSEIMDCSPEVGDPLYAVIAT
ncbi:MAG: class I SAM-dependent methyltransferase [Proteobacteria bacterium]|nr:class I SAM-dependent methyltransferase [Pseudomonadota bacterium]